MGDNGAGKSTLVKIIAGNFPPVARQHQHRGQGGAFPPADRGAPARHRDRLSGPRALRQPHGGRQRLPRARAAQADRADPASSTMRRMYQARRRALQGAEVGDAAARSGEADVGRPAPGGGDRPHAALRSEDRADGRADGGDQRAPGGGGAEPHPPAARPRHRRHPDQPPHAGRLRGRRPHRRAAARPQGRRQGDRRVPRRRK